MDSWSQLKQQMPNLKLNVRLKDHTTLEIGGPAKAFLEVSTIEELIQSITISKQLNIPFLVIGGGSNLLVSDQGVDCLIIKNNISNIKQEDNLIKVSSGTRLQELVDWTIEHGLSGMQKMTGIPGSVAGAVYGNAGAYGQTISDNLVQVLCFDPEKSEQITLSKDQCGFSYRDSEFKDNKLIILAIYFKFPSQKTKVLAKEAAETLKLRLQKYKPGIKCPGSFFKNVLSEKISPEVKARLPEYKDTYGKIPAWLFLDEVGAAGQRLGNIQIASFHGNLFINLGEGSAQDFWKLASIYQKKVKEKFDVTLEPEVQLVGLPAL